MRALVPVIAAILIAVLLLPSAATPGQPLDLPPPRELPKSSTPHMVVLVMENKSRSQILGSNESTYVRKLASRYASPKLFAIRHPSLPNYIAMTGGDTFGIASNCTDCNLDEPNVADQLESAGFSWKGYMEGAPRPCFEGASHGGYAKKHNPFMYYDSIREDPSRCSRVVPFKRLERDLKQGTLPDFALIVPDQCNSTHDCPVRTGDRFLAHVVPALLRELGPRGIFILTWDEGTDDDSCCDLARGGKIATVVAGPDVRRGAYGSGSHTTYSILRLIEEAFGLPFLGHAADPGTRSLRGVFERSPRGAMAGASRAP